MQHACDSMLVEMIAKMLTKLPFVSSMSASRPRNRLTDFGCDRRVLELDKFRCVAEKHEPD